jgi:membrane protein CcdC involved in cytochrome C biogenesis
MSSHASAVLVPALVAAFIAWRVYARARRMVGRQRFRPARSWFSVLLFPLLALVLLLPASASSVAAAALLGGIVVGCGLGVYGLKTTSFEATAEGLYYTPSAHLGIGLSLLLVVRLVFRLLQAHALGRAAVDQRPPTGSPLTLAIFGLLAGYYTVYAIGLLRWQRQVARSAARA